jgi:hypothetical protein
MTAPPPRAEGTYPAMDEVNTRRSRGIAEWVKGTARAR